MVALVPFSRGVKHILPYCISTKLACKSYGGGGSPGYVQVTSADACRMRRIEGVETVEMVYLGGMLRMAYDSLLVPVWRSVGDGFTGKVESDV